MSQEEEARCFLLRFLFFPPTGNKTKKIQKKKGEKEEEEEEENTHTKHLTERDIESEKKLNQNTRARALLLLLSLLSSLRARFIIAARFKRMREGTNKHNKQRGREVVYFLLPQV